MRYTSYAQNERQQKKAAKTVPKSIPPTTTHLRLRRSRRLLRLWIPRSHPSRKRLKSRRTHWKRRSLLWRRPKKKWHPWKRRRQRQMLRPLKKQEGWSRSSAEEAAGQRYERGRDSGKAEINKNSRKNKCRVWNTGSSGSWSTRYYLKVAI